MIKTCSTCSKEKNIEHFYTQRRGPISRPYARCKECFSKTQADGYLKNRDKRRAQRKLRKKLDPEKFKRWARIKQLRLYGMTLADYDKKFKIQSGVCAICSKTSKKRLAVDHDHKTNKVRGLLCGPCNQILGLAYDNSETLRRAAEYLKQFDAPK